MNIDDLTIGQARELSGMFGGAEKSATPVTKKHSPIPVVVCTDRRGVVFGLTDDVAARPIILTDARMCLYWSADVGGVFGLAEKGPTKGCKISAAVPKISLEGVTAIMSVDPVAAAAWVNAPIQGR